MAEIGTVTQPDEIGELITPGDSRPMGDVCAGCEELSQRVERLERRLAELDAPPERPLSTMRCYWICVGLHAGVAFLGFNSEESLTFAYRFLLGAFGTLTVCHVLSTRPFIHKLGRTMLAAAVVSAAMLGSGWVNDEMGVMEFISLMIIYCPLMVVGGWLAAKGLVALRGWRIVPPGGRREHCKVRIHDLMLVTLLAAATFGGVRWVLSGENVEIWEWLAASLYFGLPVATSTVISIFLARVLLTSKPTIGVGQLVGVVVIGLLSVMLMYGLLRGLVDEFQSSEAKELVWYVVTTTLIGMGSPLVTFLIMRSAGYRFAPGGRANENRPQ